MRALQAQDVEGNVTGLTTQQSMASANKPLKRHSPALTRHGIMVKCQYTLGKHHKVRLPAASAVAPPLPTQQLRSSPLLCRYLEAQGLTERAEQSFCQLGLHLTASSCGPNDFSGMLWAFAVFNLYHCKEVVGMDTWLQSLQRMWATQLA